MCTSRKEVIKQYLRDKFSLFIFPKFLYVLRNSLGRTHYSVGMCGTLGAFVFWTVCKPHFIILLFKHKFQTNVESMFEKLLLLTEKPGSSSQRKYAKSSLKVLPATRAQDWDAGKVLPSCSRDMGIKGSFQESTTGVLNTRLPGNRALEWGRWVGTGGVARLALASSPRAGREAPPGPCHRSGKPRLRQASSSGTADGQLSEILLQNTPRLRLPLDSQRCTWREYKLDTMPSKCWDDLFNFRNR